MFTSDLSLMTTTIAKKTSNNRFRYLVFALCSVVLISFGVLCIVLIRLIVFLFLIGREIGVCSCLRSW